MWRMSDGDRVLTEAESKVFRLGLKELLAFVESDISNQTDDANTGVLVFDRLTAEQKLTLLAEVTEAICDPKVAMPTHTAVNEGAIMAVLETFRDMLQEEVEMDEIDRTELKDSLLAAIGEYEDQPETWQDWEFLQESLVERILWDLDFEMGDLFLDMPPEQSQVQMEMAGIVPEYFLTIPYKMS